MPHRYHSFGFNGDVVGFWMIAAILLSLVCWFFIVPLIGFLLLCGFALCLASEPPRPDVLNRRVRPLGVLMMAVVVGCFCGPLGWVIHAAAIHFAVPR